MQCKVALNKNINVWHLTFCYCRSLLELRTSSPMEVVRRKSSLFRAIQYLAVDLNDFHQKYLSVSKLFGILGMLTISLFALIRLSSALLPQQILIFGMCAVDSFIAMMYCYGLMASVYSTAKSMSTRIGMMHHLQRNPWFSRFFRSWPIIKIRLGSTNFIDEFTPLIVLNFSLSQLVNLLLM